MGGELVREEVLKVAHLTRCSLVILNERQRSLPEVLDLDHGLRLDDVSLESLAHSQESLLIAISLSLLSTSTATA